ncbi:MAG: hypothetical protein RR824_11275 [Clostridia bacterium]
MTQEEREALWKKILELPEPEQNLLIGAAQMAVTLHDMQKSA